jgi:hypothetical protein
LIGSPAFRILSVQPWSGADAPDYHRLPGETTMQLRSQHRRGTAVSALLLVFQLAVALAVPLADAVLEATARDGPAHLEAQNGAPCPPGHDHLFCQFCRFNAPRLPLETRAEAALDCGVERHPAAPRLLLAHSTPAAAGPVGPRAPPIA